MEKKPKKKRPPVSGAASQRTKNGAVKSTAVVFAPSNDDGATPPVKVAGITLGIKEARNAMILSEIIGPPLSKRRRGR